MIAAVNWAALAPVTDLLHWPQRPKHGSCRSRVDAHLPAVTGHDSPALGQSKTQASPRIAPGEKGIKRMRAFGSCQLWSIVTEVEFEPPATLPGAKSGAKSNPSFLPRPLTHCANGITQQLDTHDLELVGVNYRRDRGWSRFSELRGLEEEFDVSPFEFLGKLSRYRMNQRLNFDR